MFGSGSARDSEPCVIDGMLAEQKVLLASDDKPGNTIQYWAPGGFVGFLEVAFRQLRVKHRLCSNIR